MNPQELQTPREDRRLVLSVLGGGALVLALLLGLVWMPLQRERATLAARRADLADALRPYTAGTGTNSLYDQVLREKMTRDRLRAEWTVLETRTQTLKPGAALADVLSSSEEGRIDFKVALFDARNRLGKKAIEKSVGLPSDLGMAETIGADEDTETRLWQLAATVMLLEQSIDLGIPVIHEVKVKNPLSFPMVYTPYASVMIYPVRITMTCSYAQTLAFLDALMGGGTFFALQRMDIEKPAARDLGDEGLRVTLTCGAVVFRLPPKDPAPAAEAADAGTVSALTLERWP